MEDAIVRTVRGEVEDLYREQGATLWRALVAFTGDPDVAGDAMAEAFARALRNYDDIRALPAWVWSVAFRVATAEMRDRRRELPFARLVTYEMPGSIRDLVTALRQLPPKQRLAVVLHDYADRPTSEVAEVLGSSRATVHVHLSQGRRRLQELLEGTDE